MVSNQIQLKLVEMQGQMEHLISTINSIKENTVDKVYDTKGLCSHLHLTKRDIKELMRNGDLNCSKIGRKFVFTQKNVDDMLKRTAIHYVA